MFGPITLRKETSKTGELELKEKKQGVVSSPPVQPRKYETPPATSSVQKIDEVVVGSFQALHLQDPPSTNASPFYSLWNRVREIVDESGNRQIVFQLRDDCNFLQYETRNQRFAAWKTTLDIHEQLVLSLEAIDDFIPLFKGEKWIKMAFEQFEYYSYFKREFPKVRATSDIEGMEIVQRNVDFCAILRQLGYKLEQVSPQKDVELTLPDVDLLNHCWNVLRVRNPNLPQMTFASVEKDLDAKTFLEHYLDNSECPDAFVSEDRFVSSHLVEVVDVIGKVWEATKHGKPGFYREALNCWKRKLYYYYDMIKKAETSMDVHEDHLDAAIMALYAFIKTYGRIRELSWYEKISQEEILLLMTSPIHNGYKVYLKFAGYPFEDIEEAWAHIEQSRDQG